MPPKPGYCGLTSNVVLSKQAVSLLPSKTVGGVQLVQHNGQWMKLVAAGAGNYNLVAAGAGN